MKSSKDKLVERASQLLEKAEKVKATRHNVGNKYSTLFRLENDAFFEWKSNVQNFINSACSEDSAYYKDFVEKVDSPFPSILGTGIGMLKALKEDIEGDFLNTTRDLVIAELFSDFLEIAEHLLKNDYKDPAASLTGAVLEDGLRKLAEKNNISIKSGDDISSLNKKIADKGIYNRLVQKQIQAWKAVRDSADHGKFEEYKAEDVEDMLNGVKRFITEQI